jgi:hypothetical protein
MLHLCDRRGALPSPRQIWTMEAWRTLCHHVIEAHATVIQLQHERGITVHSNVTMAVAES